MFISFKRVQLFPSKTLIKIQVQLIGTIILHYNQNYSQQKDMSSLESNNGISVTKTSNCNDEEEAYIRAMEASTSFIISAVLIAATELDLFEIIAKEGFLSPSEIASRLPTKNNPDAPSVLDQMLRLLTSHSLLNCSSRTLEDGKVETLYGISPAGKYFARDKDGVSLASFSNLHCIRAGVEMCFYMKDTVLEGGIPWIKAHKMSLFEYMEKYQIFGQTFHKAMSHNSTMILKRMLQIYNGFEGLKSLVDVGGGIGTALYMIISTYPSIAGINFDMPGVVEKAPSYNIGIEHVGGDMFVEIPKGDAILLKWVCHNWSDQECLNILKNCYLALPDAGKVIVIESIMPRTPEASSLSRCTSQMDIIMFSEFGARERMEQEFEVLAKGAGFSNIQLVCCLYGQWVMELHK